MPNKKSLSFLILGMLLGILLTTAVFSVVLRPAPAGSADATESNGRILKLAHALDQSHPVHAALVQMSKRLQELSAGQLTLQIFPNGQLGSETDTIEQLQRGALAMAKTSAATLEGFIPSMSLFGLPYLFRDNDHYWKALEGKPGQSLLAAGVGVGIHGLNYFDSGSRSFYTTGSAIRTPEDLKGRKIRVMRSKSSMDMVEQMGGAPTPIPWGELYTALQQGMVDGAENNPPSMFGSRHFEVTKFFSLDEHTRIPDIVIFSERIWKSLNSQQQGWVQQAASESVTMQRQLWARKTEEALKALEKAGVTIVHPDKKAFRAVVQSLYDAPKSEELTQLVADIQALP